MEPLTMHKAARAKLEVMQRIERGELSRAQAGRLLDLSERQVYRLCRAYRERGDRGVIHRSQGGHSARHHGLTLRNQVILLYRDSYPDYGPTLFQETLFEDHGIRIGRETLRQWLMDAGLWIRPVTGRRSRTHRKARPRRPAIGDMLQFDGSEHDWFEGRNPDLPMATLLVAVDDRTNRVFLRFAAEDTMGVFTTIRDYARCYGLPRSIYTDHGSVYGVTAGDQTQYKRAMKELGIDVIQAHSPEAKGRVERQNRTLQDRLVKALRKKNISTVEEANRFLDSEFTTAYNWRFATTPAQIARMQIADHHRRLTTPLEIERLDRALSITETRTIRKDHTVCVARRRYQIDTSRLPDHYPGPVPGTQISLRVYLDDTVAIFAGDPMTARKIPLREVTEVQDSTAPGIPGRPRTRERTSHLILKKNRAPELAQ